MSKVAVRRNSKKDVSPDPAYGTTRYSGATGIKRVNNNRFSDSLHSNVPDCPSPFTRLKLWPKKLENKTKTKSKSNICRTSTESSIISICGNGNVNEENNYCTCDTESELAEQCDCCIKEIDRDTDTLSDNSISFCDNMKEVYKLTDTSDTKLSDSYEKLVDCLNSSKEATVYNLDLFEPHPREMYNIKGKNSPPIGYDISLVLPQCVCLTNHNEPEDVENVPDEKTDIITNIICMPRITEFSWDKLQSDEINKIPEKYTTNLFQPEMDETVCTNTRCSAGQKGVCKKTDSGTMYCLHKAFLDKLRKQKMSMEVE